MNVEAKERMCSKKRRFAHESEAIRAALEVSKKSGPMRWYRCPVCGGFHITSKAR